MDRLTQRLETAQAALATLDELAHKPDRSKVERGVKQDTHRVPWRSIRHPMASGD